MKDKRCKNKSRKSAMDVIMRQNKSANNTLTRQHRALRSNNVCTIKKH